MLHCHILHHEDIGVMGQFLFIGQGPGDRDGGLENESIPGHRHDQRSTAG
jgi:hypothetical protein